MPTKSFWKCEVCGDIHYGLRPPTNCPTCNQLNKYSAIGVDDAKIAMML